MEVCTSSITGSGEVSRETEEVLVSDLAMSLQGLRTKTDVAAGTIVSYYHGLRMKAAEENPFGAPTGYAIYLEWDRERKDTSDVLDISPEVRRER